MYNWYGCSEWQGLPPNTKRIRDKDMFPNHEFDMKEFKPLHIFENAAYRGAPHNKQGTLNCSMSGEINNA
jgi:hypothetical protein